MDPEKINFMTRLIYGLMVCSLIIITTGCLAPHVILDRGMIRNETQDIVSDVMVRHEPTGKIAQVNMILPSRSFDLGFSGQPMLGKRAIVTWKERDGRVIRQELSLPDNRSRKTKGKNMTLVYTIHSSGRVSVELME